MKIITVDLKDGVPVGDLHKQFANLVDEHGTVAIVRFNQITNTFPVIKDGKVVSQLSEKELLKYK